MKDLTAHFPINLLSYGNVSRNILYELNKSLNISLFPIGPIGFETQDEGILIQECINRSKFFPIDCPHLRIYHQFSLAERVGRGPMIGFRS